MSRVRNKPPRPAPTISDLLTEPFLSPTELAKLLGIRRDSLWIRAKREGIKPINVGTRARRFRVSDFTPLASPTGIHQRTGTRGRQPSQPASPPDVCQS